jgi:hypothetical protein
MSTEKPSRPWYCSNALVNDYKAVGAAGGDLEMMKAAKWFRSMVVNLGIIAISLYALRIGGNVTVIATISLISLGAYNGVEIVDYQAVVQAIVELSNESGGDGDTN